MHEVPRGIEKGKYGGVTEHTIEYHEMKTNEITKIRILKIYYNNDQSTKICLHHLLRFAALVHLRAV